MLVYDIFYCFNITPQSIEYIRRALVMLDRFKVYILLQKLLNFWKKLSVKKLKVCPQWTDPRVAKSLMC